MNHILLTPPDYIPVSKEPTLIVVLGYNDDDIWFSIGNEVFRTFRPRDIYGNNQEVAIGETRFLKRETVVGVNYLTFTRS